ncbi:hypothetical protein HHK36_002991 [Tetracentron sinense]|uniref:Homeobox domain-containing protein n=1 Tax=Tetracentron sinense TaxID=13715 RepID=A0A835DS27_TETSI|nr:hypothetical protein HHK36_002991 [Tetracentron sinense]
MEPQQHPQQQQLNDVSSSSSSSKSSFLCRQTSTRWTPTTDQIRILKDLYYNNGVRSPSAEQIQRISARLRQYGKIEGKNVFYWFQNHKARERQKKRFTVDMSMQRGVGGSGTWKPEDSIHNNYTCIPPGEVTTTKNILLFLFSEIFFLVAVYGSMFVLIFFIWYLRFAGISSPSSPSSPGVLSVGQMGSINGYGSVLMEKSFRDCSISAGGSGVIGGSINNNLGWVGVDPYSSTYTLFDKRKSIEASEEEAAPEIETLPLFPMHGEEVAGFCTGKPGSDGYFTGWYRPNEEKVGSRTSLELSLNSTAKSTNSA